MDSTAQKREVSPESARESLIAISQSIPENIYTTHDSTPITTPEANGSGLKEHVGGGADDFRSKLISISYEAQPLPPTLENPAT